MSFCSRAYTSFSACFKTNKKTTISSHCIFKQLHDESFLNLMDCRGSAVLWFVLQSSEHLCGCWTPTGDPRWRRQKTWAMTAVREEQHLCTSQSFQISGSVSPLLWISCTRALRVSIELGLMKGKVFPEPNSSSVRRHRFLKHVKESC